MIKGGLQNEETALINNSFQKVSPSGVRDSENHRGIQCFWAEVGNARELHSNSTLQRRSRRRIPVIKRIMSLSRLCEEIGEKPELIEKFKELKSNQERIEFTYDICKTYLSNFTIRRSHKNNVTSFNLRRDANQNMRNIRQIGYHGKWDELKWVNESLAFASGPTKLKISYLLRSSILHSVGLRDAASTDMQRAIDLTGHEKEKEDLRSRIPVTKETTSVSYLRPEVSAPPLDRKKSSFFDSASEAVGLCCNDRWERHLVAQNDIKTGEVLIVEKPYASVLLSGHIYTYCAHCFRRCPSLLPCSKCCYAMFCDEECQRKALEGYHDIECDILDILFVSRMERMALLALRILICTAAQGRSLEDLRQKIRKWEDLKSDASSDLSRSGQCYTSSDFMNIYNLVTHSDERTASDLFKRCVVSAALVQLLSKHTKFFAHVPAQDRQSYEEFCVGLIFHFMQSLPCNAHEISEYTDKGFVEMGAGVYATLSLLNHCCDPNVVRHSCGDSIVLRAIKPIKKGEQIFDNYGYHYAIHTLYDRQWFLKKQYYFKCECAACCRDLAILKYMDSCDEIMEGDKFKKSEAVEFKNNADEEVYKELTKQFNENWMNTVQGRFNSKTIEEFAEYLDYLDEFVQLPWNDFRKCQEALKHCWGFTGNHFRRSRKHKIQYD